MRDVVSKYRTLCCELNMEDSKIKQVKHNKAETALYKLKQQISLMDDKSFMLELMSDFDVRIREHSAAHCLQMEVYVPKALKVLCEICDSDEYPWWLRLNAKASLKIWSEKHK